MIGSSLGSIDLVPAILLVTVVTGLALGAAQAISSAARRNSLLLPTLWLVCIAPFAPLLGQALDWSIEVERPVSRSSTASARTTEATSAMADPRGLESSSGTDASTAPTASTSPAPPAEILAEIPWVRIAWIAWAAGSSVALIRLALSFLALRALVRDARPAPDHLDAVVERARRLAGLDVYPELATTERVTTPAAVGWGRHARVLLPAASTDTLSEAEWLHVLAHEGAHHAHRDPLLLILRRLVTALWWWHPLVHRVDREIHRTREDLADNAVLREVDPVSYSETLLAWGRQTPSVPELAISLAPRHDSLERRIRNLLTPRRCTMTRSRPFALTAAVLLATSLALAASATRVVEPSAATNDPPTRAVSGVETGEWTLTFPETGSPGHLDVDIKRGDIHVTAHDDDRVVIRWEVPTGATPGSTVADGRLRARPIDLDVRQSGSTIEVNSDDYEQITRLDVLVPRRTDLTLDSYRDGRLTVRGVQGVIRARSQNNDIVLEDVTGSAELEGYNGSLSASFVAVDGPLSFDTYNGHVDLALPDDVGLAARLRTDRGSLRSAFELHDVRGSTGRTSRTADSVSIGFEPYSRVTIGSGEHPATLETTQGDIVLRRRSDAASE